MATYSITESEDATWSEDHKFKYRHRSAAGRPLAENEMGARRASGRPGVLWRWENFRPTLVYSVNLPTAPSEPSRGSESVRSTV